MLIVPNFAMQQLQGKISSLLNTKLYYLAANITANTPLTLFHQEVIPFLNNAITLSNPNVPNFASTEHPKFLF